MTSIPHERNDTGMIVAIAAGLVILIGGLVAAVVASQHDSATGAPATAIERPNR